jgi:hypothetical protein
MIGFEPQEWLGLGGWGSNYSVMFSFGQKFPKIIQK